MLTSPNRLKANEGDLHAQDQTKDEECGVCRVDSVRETTHEQEGKDVQRDEIDDEDVTAPCGHLSTFNIHLAFISVRFIISNLPCKSRIEQYNWPKKWTQS